MKVKCRICGGELKSLMDFSNMPAGAQSMPSGDDLETDAPVAFALCQCGECGTVQLDAEPVTYYRDVIRAGGGSQTMRDLRHEEYRRLWETMDREGPVREEANERPALLEVGCGRGEFLAMWEDLPGSGSMHRMGIEHRAELVREGREKGLTIHEGFPEADFTVPEAPFDAFVQFNFLEHQPDPGGMLRWIRDNLKPGGVGLVTVPSFDYMLKYDGYYEIVRDHLLYFTEETFGDLFRRNGFNVLSVRTVNRDTLEALVIKDDSCPVGRKDDTSDDGRKGDPAWKEADVKGFRESYGKLQTDVKEMEERLRDQGRTLAIWAASHQAFTLAATTPLGSFARYFIDSAPFKQGRFSPVSHLPIVSPEHFFDDPVDEILIAAPGYTKEIAGVIQRMYGDGVSVLALVENGIEEYRR